MASENKFHLSTEAAELYNTQKVPTLFEPLARSTLDAVSIPTNAAALDLACGTGIIPRLLAERLPGADRLPGAGRIVGADLNQAMIDIAKINMPDSAHKVDWFACDVTELPFDDGEFDIAFCQQGLQFFPDKPKALTEIKRVLAPGGTFTFTCWSSVAPFSKAIADSVRTHISEKAEGQALSPFAFRDGAVISSMLAEAGFTVASATILQVDRRITPARAAIRKEILGLPFEQELRAKGEAVIDTVVAEIDTSLDRYRVGDGLVTPQEAHLFQAIK
jgi:ubiquinone/menaquinone biosynthesis C-methylase UbiE